MTCLIESGLHAFYADLGVSTAYSRHLTELQVRSPTSMPNGKV